MAADLALVVGNVASGFLATLTKTPLTTSSIAKNMVVFITIGSFLGMALLLVVYGYWKDDQDRKKMPHTSAYARRAELGMTKKSDLQATTGGDAIVSPSSVRLGRRPRSPDKLRSEGSSSSSSSASGDELDWGSEGEEGEIDITPTASPRQQQVRKDSLAQTAT
jgi:hypothetical protein